MNHLPTVHFQVQTVSCREGTWRITPFSKKLGSPTFIRHGVGPFGIGPTTPDILGDILYNIYIYKTIVTSHLPNHHGITSPLTTIYIQPHLPDLLNGMILQVNKSPSIRLGSWPLRWMANQMAYFDKVDPATWWLMVVSN